MVRLICCSCNYELTCYETLQQTYCTSRIPHTAPSVALQTPLWAHFKNLHCALGNFWTRGCPVVSIFVRAWHAAGPQWSGGCKPCDPRTECTPCVLPCGRIMVSRRYLLSRGCTTRASAHVCLSCLGWMCSSASRGAPELHSSSQYINCIHLHWGCIRMCEVPPATGAFSPSPGCRPWWRWAGRARLTWPRALVCSQVGFLSGQRRESCSLVCRGAWGSPHAGGTGSAAFPSRANVRVGVWQRKK